MAKNCYQHTYDHVNKYQLLSLERPPGILAEPVDAIDLTYMLPAAAKDRGISLLDVTYSGEDPLIIFDRDGRILHRWPYGYMPGYLEVQEVSKALLEKS